MCIKCDRAWRNCALSVPAADKCALSVNEAGVIVHLVCPTTGEHAKTLTHVGGCTVPPALQFGAKLKG